MSDIGPTAANGRLQRSGYRDVDVFVRNVTRQRDEYGIDSYGATVKYEIRTDTGRKVWSHEERIHWNQRKRKMPSLVQFESEYGSGSIADIAVAALDDDVCSEMEEAAMSAEHNGSRRPSRVEADRRMTSDGRRAARVRTPKRHYASNNKRRRASSMTNLKTLKVGRCYVGVELSDGIARIEIDGPEHSANMELDHTSYVYDRSEKYLSDQKREIFDAIRSSVKSCNNGRQLDSSEFMEISDCADFIWDYFTSFHEDEIKMMQEDFMNSPYGSWFDYDKSKTSHLTSSAERTAMGNMKADDIVIEKTNYQFGYVHSYGHIYVQDLPCLTFDVSNDGGSFYVNVWLSDPNSVFDSGEYSIWWERGVFDYYEISEKLGINDDDPYYSIDDEDAVKAAVSLFLDEVSIPDDALERYYDLLDEDKYDASRSNTRRRSTRGRMAHRAPRATRRNASRRKSAWNDGFSFNGDSAWMVWYDDFAIDCDADRMPDGTWRVVYTLMDPLDTDGATGLSRLGMFDVDLSGYEYEEDALRDFMEDNVPPVPQADRDRYSLRDTVGYIMNEYGRIGTIETRKDVADAYMHAYGSLPSDDELDEIVDCINDNYFVHISSRRTAKASSCRRPNGRQARGRSARNRSVRRASAPNRKKSMRKGAGFHSIPREFGGGWIEADEVEPGRWRARGPQGGEYATRAVYGRTEQEAVRKAVKEMQGYPEARDLTVEDVMGKASGRTPSRRSASARRQAAKRRANSSLPPDDRKSSEVYAVDKTVNYILSNKDRLNGKRDNVVYDNVFDFVYNDLLSDKSLVNDLGFAFGSENPYNLAGYITQEAIDYSADTYGLTVESKRNLHRTANRKKMPVKSPRARRIAAYGRKNRDGRR